MDGAATEQGKGETVSDRDIRTIGLIGTGVIGASWAAYFLARGFDVRAFDPSPGAAERLSAAVERHWPVLESVGLAEGADRRRLAFFDRIEEALAGVDFVQENGPERIDLKMDLFRQLGDALDGDVILASSSSGLRISDVQSATRHPERVVLGHPFNPPHLIPLVEVVGGEATSARTIERALSFYTRIGKRPIHLKKEVSGHIANRLQAALWREAIHLVHAGVASVGDIDTAIAHGPGLRWALLGPFLNLHLSGGEGGIAHVLDHLGGPIQSWWDELGSPRINPEIAREIIAGTAEELADRDIRLLVAERDRILLELLQAKQQAPDLP